MRCLDPVKVMKFHNNNLPNNDRCLSALDCSENSSCVQPLDSEQLLRLVFRPTFFQSDSQANEEIIIWKGPRDELLEEGGATVC